MRESFSAIGSFPSIPILQWDERYQQILDGLPQMIWTATPEGDLDYINAWFYHYTGMPSEKPLGWDWLSVVHPEDVAISLETWTKSLCSGDVYQVKHRIRRAEDGVFVPHWVQAIALKDANGAIQKWIGSSVEIPTLFPNEKKSAWEQTWLEAKVRERSGELLQKNEELVKVNQLLDLVMHMAAHDLCSPIHQMQSLLTFCEEATREEEKLAYMQVARQALQRMDRTVQGLLQLISVQHTHSIMTRELNLAHEVALVLEELSDLLKAQEGEVITDFRDRPTLFYHESFLSSILRNLLSNAIKYGSPNRRLRIEIKSLSAGAFVHLSIKDNGIGMDLSRYQEKLFKPFSRLTSQGEGKGIGLYLIKNMVERNGGYLTVESEEGKGTTFRIFLKEYGNETCSTELHPK